MAQQSVRLARNAMGTRFEFLLLGDDPIHLRAAGEEALDEVTRLEKQLSIYRADSELSQVNARAHKQPLRIETGLFRLLARCQQISRDTQGAFDISIAPLMRAWGLVDASGAVPDANMIEEVLQHTGVHQMTLDAEASTISFSSPEAMLDLGSIGKGHALDAAVDLLREAGVEHALLHGGTSSIYGMGYGPDQLPWKISIPTPPAAQGSNGPDNDSTPLSVVELTDCSLSVSAVWGKSFERGGELFGHVLNPRNGRPVKESLLSAVKHPSATLTDALTTALLVVGWDGFNQVADQFENPARLLVTRSPLTTGWNCHRDRL